MNAIVRSSTPVLQPSNFQELVRFAEMAANSDLMPKDYKGRPGNIMIAVQMGSEIGLSPMQAIQNISVINGRPSIWGDAMLGLVRAHPKCGGVEEWVEGEGDQKTAYCEIKRTGEKPVKRKFSVADAKTAGLWNKTGPWQQYPERMMAMRARGFACRDAFPDALKGLHSAEEATDIPKDMHTGPTIEARAEPTQKVADIPTLDEPPKPKRGFPEWLAEFKLAADACEGQAEFEELCSREEITRVTAKLKNGMKEEFDAVVGLTLDRLTGMDIVSQQMET